MIRSVPLNAQDVWINIEADALEKHPEWIEEFDLDDEIIEYCHNQILLRFNFNSSLSRYWFNKMIFCLTNRLCHHRHIINIGYCRWRFY